VNEDEYKIVDKFVSANLWVTATKDAIKYAKADHREAIKEAALAEIAYRELLKRRMEARNAAQ
jgi:hypothetical protein